LRGRAVTRLRGKDAPRNRATAQPRNHEIPHLLSLRLALPAQRTLQSLSEM